jgi:probable rRNA maturation factor
LSLDLADVPDELRGWVTAALDGAGVSDGHVAVQVVDEGDMRKLNQEHRGIDRPTDVLAFPVDGSGAVEGPRELGDVVVCPDQCEHVGEAIVHGVLHLCGYDHETDDGEMLALQEKVMGTSAS